jgi:hypothetical protein
MATKKVAIPDVTVEDRRRSNIRGRVGKPGHSEAEIVVQIV